ncbi:MAG: ammonia-forming cytochrome c nitrite reductase subunit c552 [Deltaproteobacteria bacterium]|nr:ammonia-forming cytochrome c nitrite reductase subunit c552 [Deltaproteobacteria bacterium]
MTTPAEPVAPAPPASPVAPAPDERKRRRRLLLVLGLVVLATVGVTALLMTIFERRLEARTPFVRLVEVSEATSDPAPWGVNWPREYDSYQRTVDVTRTRFGGSSAMPDQKLERDPWLKRLYAGYAFSIDYRERRGHAYMLYDQEHTERVTKKPQPGACLHCHASIIPTWRRVGREALGRPVREDDGREFDWDAVMKGFETMSRMSYVEAHGLLLATPDGTPGDAKLALSGEAQPAVNGEPTTTREKLDSHAGEAHPVACVDCHDPQSMAIRVTRPGFVRGIAALAASDAPVPHLPSVQRWREGGRKKPFDPNVDATRQEMRSFVCGQCHVEYYCGPRETLFFPWAAGLRADDIESVYEGHRFPDGEPFHDFVHAETGARVYKAQHPEFEMWSQGVHARSGVSCSDCHMPYVREGAMKVSSHWVRSPLLQVNSSCQPCHNIPEAELLGRVAAIQDRTRGLLDRAGVATTDMLDAIVRAKAAGATPEQLAPILELQRKGAWRLDFVSSENSMGFHADQEAARLLAEAIDDMRRAQAAALSLGLSAPTPTPTPAPTPPPAPTPTPTPAPTSPPAPTPAP